ncbi:DUF2087 domain-containing protein [Sebaldella sp. S0638]|uniref:DUF2087 domain-containing protein n=1 Tax=Sebaldella sp. S0638 TaxID=2957809 RepID=UPI00209ECB2C|nr:DUF2087 domain-containing protein [Sebaldella sp. S0638]MCP1223341.1 DUF2087 domain-containing protein [Sebaldella sp. S0638]
MKEEIFWNSDIKDIKKGYVENEECFECLLCGMKTEKGIIYKEDNTLRDAEKEMKFHISKVHVSVFDYLINLNKKLTGISEQQKKLLKLFYQGKNDKEVQKETETGSMSTIRNHRFTLKEKERQAKVFLSVMELLRERDQNAAKFIEPHKTARFVDDRYNITVDENQKMLEKFFEFQDGKAVKLKRFPGREKQRVVVIRELSKSIESGKKYSEKEINSVIKKFFDDYVTLRRYLIEYGFLDRKKDGSEYWLK